MMTGQTILNHMLLLKRIISRTTNMKIQFLETESVDLANTDFNDGQVVITLGTQELVKNKHNTINFLDGIDSLVVLLHETCGHGSQMINEFNQTRPLSRILAFNYAACQTSPFYYANHGYQPDSSYWFQPYEIAAEYAGIRGAKTYLTQILDENRADTILCAYINRGAAFNRTFTVSKQGEYTATEQILSDLNHKFRACVRKHRSYNLFMDQKFPSIINKYVRQTKDGAFVLSINEIRNGLKQDQMMTAIYFDQSSSAAWLKHQQAFQNIDLRISSIHKQYGMEPKLPPKPVPLPKDIDLKHLTPVDLTLTEEDLAELEEMNRFL